MAKKTADQMFRELGYREAEPVYFWEARAFVITEDRTTWRIAIRHDHHVEFKENGKDCMMSFEEILACAQLIREMEAEEND